QGEDRVIYLHTCVVRGDGPARGHLLALIIARQVWADYLPAHAFILGLEQHLRGEVQGFGIMRRKHDWLSPLEAIFLVGCGRANWVDRPRRHVLGLLRVMIVARDFSAI